MVKQLSLIIGLLLIVTPSESQNVGNIAGDPDFFPIAVWVQNPENAAAYKSNGINIFVGIWGGLDKVKFDYLKAAGIRVICDQNDFGLSRITESTIYAWMHGDEPDNAQMNRKTKSYDPCVDPSVIIS